MLLAGIPLVEDKSNTTKAVQAGPTIPPTGFNKIFEAVMSGVYYLVRIIRNSC